MFVRLCVCWRIETDCFDVVTWWSTYAISDFSVHKSHPLDQQSIRLCERWEWHSVVLSVWLWQDISKGCRWIFMKFGNWKGYYLVRDRSLSSQYWDFWEDSSSFWFCRYGQSCWGKTSNFGVVGLFYEILINSCPNFTEQLRISVPGWWFVTLLLTSEGRDRIPVTITLTYNLGKHFVKISAYSDRNCRRRCVLKMRTDRQNDRVTNPRLKLGFPQRWAIAN